ncbi:kinase-like protein [Ascobolus immersus RN42]|uniref:Kinase-like protein n=1 Tax=Ascobolus immersus RN42 TaxID=1160509 RepID=A0A3N4HY51_ASCIM|nr:kinase-like protein [Ascobolus immersus RN42]
MNGQSANVASLTERYEVVKEVGDGSFGNVVLARARSSASNVAKRGTMVAIKTMKKSFDSFAPCLELREVIFLKQLPPHVHLVPALEIFLDPTSKKLHIAMEYMDGNLYQLMKARDHKPLEVASVKSILFQILAGLEHIHAHGFFHRDIKPENILVSTSGALTETSNAFRRYSSMVTPPQTPQVYSVKIADFGLAREIGSKMPYTTYVSTRWYRAPEVLLRAGEYSAPVDIWAVGAMAVEIATLKPLFPGQNEVDQVWRVCEVMGSPGNWVSKSGRKLGGGEWKDGTRLAQKLGFSFPRMTPVHMESILATPQWPASLCNFVTQCLLWDPKARPTSVQALQHEFFRDAVDPLKVKPSVSVLKKTGELSTKASQENMQGPGLLSSRPSWFRKSFIGTSSKELLSPPASTLTTPGASPIEAPKKNVDKRATWHPQRNGAPMPILPTIRPVSPLSDAVTAQAAKAAKEDKRRSVMDEKAIKKIGRQLSMASNNHYNDSPGHVSNNGQLASPPPGKESLGFFSHLRKRARRLSGRPTSNLPASPNSDDLEANAGCNPWPASARSSMILDHHSTSHPTTSSTNDMRELDRAIRAVDSALDPKSTTGKVSFPPTPNASRSDNTGTTFTTTPTSITTTTRTTPRRTTAKSHHLHPKYDTPMENDELLHDEVSAYQKVLTRMTLTRKPSSTSVGGRKPGTQQVTPPYQSYQSSTPVVPRALRHSQSTPNQAKHTSAYYPSHTPIITPTQSNRHSALPGTLPGCLQAARPLDVPAKGAVVVETSKWPTPPYEEGEWGLGYFGQEGSRV